VNAQCSRIDTLPTPPSPPPVSIGCCRLSSSPSWFTQVLTAAESASGSASLEVKKEVASQCLEQVAKAMQKFSAHKLLASYGVLLVAAAIHRAKNNWRSVFESGILAAVAQAVETFPDDAQISTFGPQLLALSKAQVCRGSRCRVGAVVPALRLIMLTRCRCWWGPGCSRCKRGHDGR